MMTTGTILDSAFAVAGPSGSNVRRHTYIRLMRRRRRSPSYRSHRSSVDREHAESGLWGTRDMLMPWSRRWARNGPQNKDRLSSAAGQLRMSTDPRHTWCKPMREEGMEGGREGGAADGDREKSGRERGKRSEANQMCVLSYTNHLGSSH